MKVMTIEVINQWEVTINDDNGVLLLSEILFMPYTFSTHWPSIVSLMCGNDNIIEAISIPLMLFCWYWWYCWLFICCWHCCWWPISWCYSVVRWVFGIDHCCCWRIVVMLTDSMMLMIDIGPLMIPIVDHCDQYWCWYCCPQVLLFIGIDDIGIVDSLLMTPLLLWSIYDIRYYIPPTIYLMMTLLPNPW